MIQQTIRDNLEELFGGRISFDEPLNRHCTFNLGGKADIFFRASDANQVKQASLFCREQNILYYIFGAGSNLLVPDEGYRGMIIRIDMRGIRFKGETLIAQAGAGLQKLVRQSIKNNLSGLEFTWSIPGSVGGAVVMNAGALGHEIGERVELVRAIDADGEYRELKQNELGFGYRESNIRKSGLILLEIELKLERVDPEIMQQRAAEVKSRRKNLNPKYPSAGCVFKNPADRSAGQLIDQCGLKGHQIGGARVWDEHANFIINSGGASYEEVKGLMRLIADKVKQKDRIELEPEIIDIGEEV
jgi:UDP-N-acetylmuramate dehydrogenase